MTPDPLILLLTLVTCCAPACSGDAGAGGSTNVPGETTRILQEELQQLGDAMPPEVFAAMRREWQQAAQSVERDEAGARRLAATARYFRLNELWSAEPLSPAVHEQLQELAREILRYFRDGYLGSLPLSCSVQERMAYDRENFVGPEARMGCVPYFRRMMDANELTQIKENIQFRMESMKEYQGRLLMNSRGLSSADRNLLWEAFIRQAVRELIAQRAIEQVNARIYRLELQMFASGPSAPPDRAAAAPRPSEIGRIDLARNAEERSAAFFFAAASILLNESSRRGNSPDLCAFDIRMNMSMSYGPFTEICLRARLAVLEKWLVFAVSDIAANDNGLLGETQLAERCVLFERKSADLYTYEWESGQLRHVGRPQAASPAGVVSLFTGNTYSNPWRVLAWTSSVVPVLGAPASDGVARLSNPTLPVSSLFGHTFAAAALETDRQKRTWTLTGKERPDTATLTFAQVEGPWRLTRLSLPAMAISGTLRMEEAEDGSMDFHGTIFPQGLTIDIHTPADTVAPAAEGAPCLLSLAAPTRMVATTSLLGATVIREDDIPSLAHDPARLARAVVQNDPIFAAKDILRTALHAFHSGMDARQGQRLLARIDALGLTTTSFPEACLFRIRDIRIGLLLYLGRGAEARLAYAEQQELLKTVTDPDLARRYTQFYSELLAGSDDAPASPSSELRATTKQWSCYYAQLGVPESTSAAPAGSPAAWRGPDSLSPTGFASPGDRARGARNLDVEALTSAPARGTEEVDLKEELQRVLTHSGLSEEKRRIIHTTMDRLWQQHPRLRFVDANTAYTISRGWCDPQSGFQAHDDPYKFINRVYTLRWQTYHAAKSVYVRLPENIRERKRRQYEVMERFLHSIEQRWGRDDVYPAVVRRAVSAEVAKSIRRLRQEINSPFNPLCYHPLTEESFRQAAAQIEKKIAAEIAVYENGYDDKEASCRQDALEKSRERRYSIDFFQNELRSWAVRRAKICVGNIVGDMFLEYCLRNRDMKFDDREMFPVSGPCGIQISYKLIEGLYMVIVPKYKEMVPGTSGESAANSAEVECRN